LLFKEIFIWGEEFSPLKGRRRAAAEGLYKPVEPANRYFLFTVIWQNKKAASY
jgi:hypothetical protein